MDRRDFLKSTVAGLGAVALLPSFSEASPLEKVLYADEFASGDIICNGLAGRFDLHLSNLRRGTSITTLVHNSNVEPTDFIQIEPVRGVDGLALRIHHIGIAEWSITAIHVPFGVNPVIDETVECKFMVIRGATV